MKEVIKKEIIHDLSEALRILEKREKKNIEELRVLSNHGIDNVALHKDLDLISVTVLIYSLHKIHHCISPENYDKIIKEIAVARKAIQENKFRRYNQSIKALFRIIRECSSQVKVHLQDVMHAAKIKKGTALLQKGLSIGQAAGLMGLTNWDLQQYASRTHSINFEHEAVPAEKRTKIAFKIFGVSL